MLLLYRSNFLLPFICVPFVANVVCFKENNTRADGDERRVEKKKKNFMRTLYVFELVLAERFCLLLLRRINTNSFLQKALRWKQAALALHVSLGKRWKSPLSTLPRLSVGGKYSAEKPN